MKRLFGILVALSLAACSQPPKEDAKYQPVVNPHPKYFFTVSGKVDRELVGKIVPTIEAVYTTRNKACDIVTNKLVGATWRTKTIVYKPNVVRASGHYRFKFPLDNYLPGYCHWKLFRLNDYSGSNDSSTLTNFSPCAGDSFGCDYKSVFDVGNYLLKTKYNNFCRIIDQGKVDCYKFRGKFFSNTPAVPDNNNYSLEENYIFVKE